MTLLLRAIFVFFVLVVGFTSSATAQERLESLPQGQTVRVTSNLLLQPSVGTFHRVSADSLWLMGGSQQVVALPLARIQRIEAKRTDRVTGALAGAGIGAPVLTTGIALYGASQGGFICCGDFRDDLGFAASFGVPIGGVLGGVTGGILGVTRWEPLYGLSPHR